MIGGIFRAVGEVFGFMTTLSDSTQRRERFELLLITKAKKALEAAEKHFHLTDQFLAGQISKKKYEMMNKRFRKIFFEND